MCPEYISTILWPLAVKCFKDMMNHLLPWADGCTPFEMLAGLESAPTNVSIFHTFSCPCYVLDHRLQSGSGKFSTWKT
jgi:hypothetical protein